jgi:hypothetical protein
MAIRDEIIVTRFADITITMYYHPALGIFKEHETDLHSPHFFAVSDNDKDGVIIDIENCCVARFNQEGYQKLPEEKLKTILVWCRLHKGELLDNWEKAKDGQCLISIPPPEY